MKRRGFLQALAVLLAGASAPPMTPPAMASTARRVIIQESPLAGFQYYAGPHIWKSFVVGKPLDLLREPGNPHDRRAVAVFYDGFRIGYVPRSQNTFSPSPFQGEGWDGGSSSHLPLFRGKAGST